MNEKELSNSEILKAVKKALKAGEAEEKNLKKRYGIFYELIEDCKRHFRIAEDLKSIGQTRNDSSCDDDLKKIREKAVRLCDKNLNLDSEWKSRNPDDEIFKILQWAINKSSKITSSKVKNPAETEHKNKFIKIIMRLKELILVIYEKTAKAFFDSYFGR